MPRYYCDYCDTYLTHDSPSVRKQHNAGYKHKANVRLYYQQFEAQLNQSLIDQKVKEHLGAFRPPGLPLGVPYNHMRPGVAILPTPMMAMSGATTFPPGAPLMSFRPPVLPRPPPGAPVYMSSTMPMPMPMMMAPPPGGPLPGPPPTDGQRPPPVSASPIGMPPPSSGGGGGGGGGVPSFYNPVYQGAVPTAAAASGETPNNTNSQAPEASDN